MEEKNLTALWVIIAIVAATAILGGLSYYLYWQSNLAFQSQQQALEQLRQQVAVVGQEEDEITEEAEEATEEVEYRTFDRGNAPDSFYQENYTFEYANGWHVYMEHGWQPQLVDDWIVASPNPIKKPEGAEIFFPVEIFVKYKNSQGYSEAVEKWEAPSLIESTEIVNIAGVSGEKILYSPEAAMGTGNDIVVYTFETQNAKYRIKFNYPAVSEPTVELPEDWQRIVESFSVSAK